LKLVFFSRLNPQERIEIPMTYPVFPTKLAVAGLSLWLGACTQMQVVPENSPVQAGEMGTVFPSATVTMPSTDSSGVPQHVVQRGETLYAIGQRYNLSYQELAAWNGIGPPYSLQVGQALLLAPVGSSGVTSPAITSPAPLPSGPRVVEFDVNTGQPVVSYNTPSTSGYTQQQPTYVQPPYVQPSYVQPSYVQPSYVQPTTPAAAGQSHQVQAGDTLYSLARRYGVNVQQLAASNGVQPPYNLSVGQTLWLGNTQTVSAVNAAPVSSGGTYHTVQAGESLHSIATRYRRQYQELAAWNGLQAPYYLRVGQSLMVAPAGAAPLSAPAAPSSGSFYTVVAGDTLYNIAQRAGRSVEEIALWNGLTPPYRVTLGQRLQISQAGMQKMGFSSTASAKTKAVSTSSTTPKKAAAAKTPAKTSSSAKTSTATPKATLKAQVTSSQPVTVTPPVATVAPVVSHTPEPAAEPAAPSAPLAPVVTAPTPPATAPGQPVQVDRHVVAPGETLASIASQYGQNTHELALWNGIAPPYPIYPGQTLMIYK